MAWYALTEISDGSLVKDKIRDFGEVLPPDLSKEGLVWVLAVVHDTVTPIDPRTHYYLKGVNKIDGVWQRGWVPTRLSEADSRQRLRQDVRITSAKKCNNLIDVYNNFYIIARAFVALQQNGPDPSGWPPKDRESYEYSLSRMGRISAIQDAGEQLIKDINATPSIESAVTLVDTFEWPV